MTFSDVLGQQFSLYAASISQYRTLSFSYLNLAHRFNYALQAFSQTSFFYGNLENILYDGNFIVDRDLALATRTVRGGTIFGIWPFNRYRRAELFGGFMQPRRTSTTRASPRRPISSRRISSAAGCSAAATSCRSASTSSRRRRSSANSARWRPDDADRV